MLGTTPLIEMSEDKELLILMEYIRTLNLKPGEKLPSILSIAGALGLNQSQVRSAVLKASALGIVETRSRSGTYLMKFDFSRILDLFTLMIALGDVDTMFMLIHVHDLKTTLEKSTFAAAARNATDEEIHELGMYIDESERTTEIERFIELDEKVHVVIARMSRNPFYVTLLSIINSLLRKDRVENMSYFETRSKTISEHRKIFDAIRQGDAGRAVQLAEHHGDRRKSLLMGAAGKRNGR